MQNSYNRKHHLKYSIAIAGAAETGSCAIDALEKAEQFGQAVAKKGLILITGVTTGIPYWTAKGAKEAGGIVIGISPAANENDHIKKYQLPIDYHDFIIYTGFDYAGRNLLLSRAADAMAIICGRLGTLNTFTVGLEDGTPIGVLKKSGGTADLTEGIMQKSQRGPGKIVFSEYPADLLDKMLKLISEDRESR